MLTNLFEFNEYKASAHLEFSLLIFELLKCRYYVVAKLINNKALILLRSHLVIHIKLKCAKLLYLI
jgi:hypothetical protein